ncbi:alpha/beta hydrolase [Paenibacillus cremeus]|uniref:Alpha/beta fold hydrolase n=1 Tax=Paenibacillus cremeus TaxID=2163881 RepID=A0A559KDT8_9BACL|nr:alpha/beta fold hydrolase [Paenibacillus cremeus]TVY10290.1 alpha/beta fold hydrolase [Paenibacillus cremeus]
MTRIYRTPEPFILHGHGDRALTELLMIHGFTGSPSEFRRIGYFMNDLGYTVRGILLPGHGTTPEDMIKTGWDDWHNAVLKSYDDIRNKEKKRIFAIGHSMGGLLALKLSMERMLSGVVTLSAPIFFTTWKTVLAVLAQYFIKYVDKKPTVAAHIIEEACTYDRAPVPCVVHLRKLLKLVKSSLDQVRVPIFIGQGERDNLVIPRRSADYIYSKVASPLRQVTYYSRTSHSILLEEEWAQVYEDIHQFIETVTQLGAWKQAAVSEVPYTIVEEAGDIDDHTRSVN